MSKGSGDGLPTGRAGVLRVGLTALALGGAMALAGVAGARAQGTPEAGPLASPASGPCEAPEGTAGMAATPLATPATGEGTPEAVEPLGTPVEDAGADEAIAAVENFVNCWNAGELEAVLGLVTPNLLQTKFGVADADEAAAVLGGMAELPAYSIVSTGDVQSYDDGRFSIDLEYLLGDYQFTAARWFLTMAGDQRLIDAEELLLPQPDADSTVISVSFLTAEVGISFDQSADEVTGGRTLTPFPAIILHAANDGDTPRIMTVVRFPADMAGTPMAGDLPAGEFVAQISLAAGEEADVALLNLDAGSYAIGEMGGASVPLTIAEAEA